MKGSPVRVRASASRESPANWGFLVLSPRACQPKWQRGWQLSAGFLRARGYNGGVTTTYDPARPLLTVPEVADRLRVSVKTVRRRIESGELLVVRIGSGTRAPVRVDADELDRFLHPRTAA